MIDMEEAARRYRDCPLVAQSVVPRRFLADVQKQARALKLATESLDMIRNYIGANTSEIAGVALEAIRKELSDGN